MGKGKRDNDRTGRRTGNAEMAVKSGRAPLVTAVDETNTHNRAGLHFKTQSSLYPVPVGGYSHNDDSNNNDNNAKNIRI